MASTTLFVDLEPQLNKDGSLPLTPYNLYVLFGDFLKNWLNIVCFYKGLYPKHSFSLNKYNYMGLVVPVNRNPKVLKWQDDFVLNFIRNLINVNLTPNDPKNKNNFQRLSLVIFKNREKKEITERLVIDLNNFYVVNDPKIIKKTLSKEFNLTWDIIYENFRAYVFQLLSVIDDKNKRDPNADESSTFEIFLETTGEAHINKNDNNWVLNYSKNIVNPQTNTIYNKNKSKIAIEPLYPVSVGPLVFDSFIETIAD
ncbi:Rev7p [Ascoidea rubescens DSM 1968]|uniref:DNA-binding protein n=1 Tax=Ascoidea rubescens DSM 1968 TaxID=1344418 RepID=A0A1D2V9X7_9ASCO|nr:DNA-binding protein [Ascoidea rubescens DSM 1968]ODV58450.1 DNA-binding protein [Ascoidea rubescens DSM 1968]